MCGFFLIMKLVKLIFQLLACLDVPNDSYCCSSFSQCFLALLGACQCPISTCHIALVPFVLSHGPQCVLVVPCHHPHCLIANLILLIVVMMFSQCCPSQTRTSPNLPSPLGAEIQSGMLGSKCLGGPNPCLGHPIGTLSARNPSKKHCFHGKNKRSSRGTFHFGDQCKKLQSSQRFKIMQV